MLIAAVDICNTLADILSEVQKYIGPWPFDEYQHPSLTDDFFKSHPDVFLNAKPYKGAVSGMWRMKEYFNIVYISARPEWAFGITKLWLDVCGFPAGKLILTREKAKIAQRISVSVAIEDAPFEIDSYLKAGIPVIVKAQNYNKNYSSRFEWQDFSERGIASGL